MPIPLEFCEVWFQLNVAGDNEPMFTHMAYGVTATVTQAAVDAGFNAWTAHAGWRGRFDSSVTLFGGHVLEQTTAGIRRWDAAASPTLGTGAACAPNNVATILRKSTALGGRRNRGRMFIPNPIEGEVSSAGVYTGGAIISWNSAAGAILPGGSIHTAFGFLGDAVVLHDTGSQTPAVVTNLTCQSRVGTQRRRLRS